MQHVINISTDKAVSPVNTMGAIIRDFLTTISTHDSVKETDNGMYNYTRR